MSRRHLERRFWIESTLTVIGAAASALAAVWPDWIERSTGLAPDAGDGSTEWGWALALALVAATCSGLAWRSWRRAQH